MTYALAQGGPVLIRPSHEVPAPLATSPFHIVWVVRVAGDDGELRPWHYICIQHGDITHFLHPNVQAPLLQDFHARESIGARLVSICHKLKPKTYTL